MFFYIFKGDGNSVYSPEFRRGGLEALFACLILQVLTSPTLNITIEGRAEDGVTWSTVGGFASITTTGAKSVSLATLPQILRYKFDVTGASDTSGVAIQLYSPQWRD